MRSILDEFVCREGCPFCLGTGHVCAEHPSHAWGPLIGDEPDGLFERADGAWLDASGACWCDSDGGAPCPKVPA